MSQGEQLLDVLHKLGVSEIHFEKFMSQEITLYDLFLLTKSDLQELGLPIGARNRVLAFQKVYKDES